MLFLGYESGKRCTKLTKENTELDLGLTELELVEKQKKKEIQDKVDKVTDFIYSNLQKIVLDINKEGLRYVKNFEQIFLAEKILSPDDRSGYKYQRLVLELTYFGTWAIKSYNCTKVLRKIHFPVLEENFNTPEYEQYRIHSETIKGIDVGFDSNYGRYHRVTEYDLQYPDVDFPQNTKIGAIKLYKKTIEAGRQHTRYIVQNASELHFYRDAVKELIKNIKNNKIRSNYKHAYATVYENELQGVKKDVKSELLKNSNIDDVLGEIE